VPSFRNLTLSRVSQLISTQALTVSRYDALRLQYTTLTLSTQALTVSRYCAHASLIFGFFTSETDT
jgi:hypothetical protein